MALRAKHGKARAEVRRLQNQLAELAEKHRQQLDQIANQETRATAQLLRESQQAREQLKTEHARALAELNQQMARLRSEAEDANTLSGAAEERAKAAEDLVAQLRAEVDIFKARDELWAQWEMRERARLEAETARFAAAKVRALELPHYETET